MSTPQKDRARSNEPHITKRQTDSKPWQRCASSPLSWLRPCHSLKQASSTKFYTNDFYSLHEFCFFFQGNSADNFVEEKCQGLCYQCFVSQFCQSGNSKVYLFWTFVQCVGGVCRCCCEKCHLWELDPLQASHCSQFRNKLYFNSYS